MVIEALIDTIVGIVRGLLSLVPMWAPDADALDTGGMTVGSFASAMNGYFPVTVLGVCLGLVFGFKAVLWVWRIAVFIYHQFWGSS